MNERLDQLVSYSIEVVEVNGRMLPSYFDHTKFAKLIILECMEELTKCPIKSSDVVQDRIHLAEHLSKAFNLKM
jgi:hypothetical protein